MTLTRRARQAPPAEERGRPTATLHLIDSLGPGGAERSLAELMPTLLANGFTPTVAFFESREDSIQKEFTALGIETVHIDGRGWVHRFRDVRRLLRELRPAVLHTTLFNADVVGRLASVGLPHTVLTSLVNTSYDSVRYVDARVRPSRLRAAQAVDAVTARLRGDLFHAITEAVANSAIRHLRLPPTAVVVVPRGRSRDRIGEPTVERRRRARTELGVAPNEFLVLHIGREDHQKGHADLLRGFHDAAEVRPELRLVLAGRRGNASAAIDDLMTSRSLAERVARLGHVDDVGSLLAAADLFLFPSLYEGLGGSVLEAMAMEVPVVATRLPALREVLGVNAWFVPVRSSPAIANAIVEAASQRHLARMRALAARQRFEVTYSDEVVNAQMLELLVEASAARRRRSSHGVRPSTAD